MILKKKVSVTPNTRENQVLGTKETPKKEKGEVDILDISHSSHVGDSLRGLFYITKGQYSSTGKTFRNLVSGSVSHIGGYDPEDPNTIEWYMVRDHETHNCIGCSSDLDKVVQLVYDTIKRYKGSAKKYFKEVSNLTSDDTYEVRYLGHAPLSTDSRSKKVVGRCPRVSPIDRYLYDCVYQEYGFYYRNLIEEEEEKAYEDLVEERPINKTKKIMERGGNKLRMTLESGIKQQAEVFLQPKKIKVIKRVL